MSLVSCSEALISDSNASQLPFGPSDAIGTQTASLDAKVYYWKFDTTPVQKQLLDATNKISVQKNEALVLQFKAKVTGNEKTQKGFMYVYDASKGTVLNSILITPTKWRTLTTNPALLWTTSGTYNIQYGVIAPDGKFDINTLQVVVS